MPIIWYQCIQALVNQEEITIGFVSQSPKESLEKFLGF